MIETTFLHREDHTETTFSWNGGLRENQFFEKLSHQLPVVTESSPLDKTRVYLERRFNTEDGIMRLISYF
jgi:hypothetical protein